MATTAANAQSNSATRAAIDLISVSDSVEMGGTFEATFRILGPSEDTTLQVALHEPLATREQLHLDLGGEPTTDVASLLEPIDLTELATQPTGDTYRIQLDTSDPSLAIEPFTVSTVQLALRAPSGVIEDRLTLLLVVTGDRQAGETPSFSVATIVPFAAPPMLQPNGTTGLEPEDRRALEATVDSLAATAGIPVTIAANPETLIGLLESGSTRDAELVEQMQRTIAGRETLQLPFVRLEADEWMQSDHTSEFVEQISVGKTAIEAALGQSPALGTWVARERLAAPTLTQLAALGLADRVVVPSEATVPLQAAPLPLSDGQRFELVDSNDVAHDALVADGAIAAHFDRSGNPILDAHHLLGDLAYLAMAAPDVARGTVIDPPDEWIADDRLLTRVISGIDDHPLLRPATVSDLFAQVSPLTLAASQDGAIVQRELTDTAAPLALTLEGQRAEAQNALVSFGNLVPDSDATALLQRLLLVSASSDLAQDEQLAYLDAIVNRVEQDRSSISTINADRVTLSSRSGLVPISLRNDGTASIEVLVTFVSDKLTFPDGPIVPLTLEPGITDLSLPVDARASGDATLDVVVTSPDRGIELNRSRVIVRSTALSGVGLLIAAVALLFLVVWWVRNLRSNERNKRLLPAEPVQPTG